MRPSITRRCFHASVLIVSSSTLNSCAGEQLPHDESRNSSSARQANSEALKVWNGEEGESSDVAAAVALFFNNEGARSTIRRGINAGTATGYFRAGCFLTNRHVLGSEKDPDVTHVRISGFSVVDNAGVTVQSGDNRTEIEADRRKLQKGLVFPVLQAKELIVGDEMDALINERLKSWSIGSFGRDLAAFYVPPGGWQLKGGVPIPLSMNSGMFLELEKFIRFDGIGATKTLRGAIENETVEVRGYGYRNFNHLNNEPGSPLRSERIGIERFGFMGTLGLEDCIGNQPSLDSCASIILGTLNKSRQSSMRGDSGGKISADDSIIAVTKEGRLPSRRIESPNAIEPLPPPYLQTAGVNVFESETYKFLTDATYKLDEGRNVPVICRPKPFVSHGPGVAIRAVGPGNQFDWFLNPLARGGYVLATNFDDMNEYKPTRQICGRESSDQIPKKECAHNTWDNKYLNNAPLISLTLQAVPWPGYRFVKWVAPSSTVCLCDPIKALCTQTNEQVEKVDPKRLVPRFAQSCLAVFEKLPAGPGGCDPMSSAGCSTAP
ncbi:MAG: hypothetical protein RIQ81_2168 [Pseudomonadota bacterium]|jgi:hypothetical protein